MKEKVLVAPSLLSADFSKIGEEVARVQNSGADLIHLDVMDGVFVPNITFGIKMVADIKKNSSIPLDCHLMIVNPEKYIEKFANAGANYITVHYETCKDNLLEVLKQVKSYNVKCGVAINPDTDIEKIQNVIEYCDLVLVMSVFPGFGGQKFIESSLQKCSKFRKIIDDKKYNALLEIDGGINGETARKVKDVGVDILVAGSYIFSSDDYSNKIKTLKSV